MGNELSTLGGACAVVGTSVASGVCLGQVEALNNAVVETAKFTGKSFMQTNVRHIGETAGLAVGTAATSVAAGVCLGQVDSLNKAVVTCAELTGNASVECGKTALETLNDTADSVPLVGHVKGGIHYACGDKQGGDRAMKASSRTVGVVGGAVGGFVVGGPAAAVAGGVAGGAAMDGITTGVESAVVGEFSPNGQIAAWSQVANAKDGQDVVEGVVGGVLSPVMDGVAGYGVGKGLGKVQATRAAKAAAVAAKGEAPLYAESMSANAPELHNAPRNAAPTRLSAPAPELHNAPLNAAPTHAEVTAGKTPASVRSSSGASSAGRGSVAVSASALSDTSSRTTQFTDALSDTSSRTTQFTDESFDWGCGARGSNKKVTLYRGCATGRDPLGPPPPGLEGNGGCTLGPGSYWTTDLEQARKYAADANNGSVWKIEVGREDMQGASRWMSRKNDGAAGQLMDGNAGVVEYFDVASTMHVDGPAGEITTHTAGGRQFRFRVENLPTRPHAVLVP